MGVSDSIGHAVATPPVKHEDRFAVGSLLVVMAAGPRVLLTVTC